MKIPLSTCSSSPRIIWTNFRYEHLPWFYYHFGLVTHDMKVCMTSSGLNVWFGVGRHARFEE